VAPDAVERLVDAGFVPIGTVADGPAGVELA
jgi:hypothetical protein